MKKSQIQSQVLVYILALFIIGVIMVYGYKSIINMRERAGEAEFIKFRNTVDQAVNSLDYGSVKKRTFFPPRGYRQVCFGIPNKAYPPILNNYPYINDSLNGGVANTVFLYPDGSRAFEVPDITVESNFKCYNITSGRVTVTLSGQGSTVKIS